MKHHLALILAALFMLALCVSCQRESLTQQRIVWEVQCDLQIVTMPEELALPLVDHLRDARRAESAFKDVQKLLADKRATLVGWPALTTKSGQRAEMEQVIELRYATEYQGSTATSPTQNVDQSSKTDPAMDANSFEAMPVEFETRNTGVTFEVEPVVAADGETIDINMVPQDIRLLGWTTATILRDPPGVKLTVDQPRFLANRLTTSMTFRNGERKLIGLFKESEPAGKVELFILRVDATKRKVPIDRPIPPPPQTQVPATPAAPPAPGPPADATNGGHVIPESR